MPRQLSHVSAYSPVPPVRSALPEGDRGVRLADVLGALTYALDLTEGQRPGHTLRTAVFAMRLAEDLDLPQADREALYYACLLKDAGCSTNAARMATLFGSDDQDVKRNMRLVDWHDRWRLAMRTAANCGVGRSPLAKVRHFLTIARTPTMTHDIIAARCERGAAIAAYLGFSSQSAEAIHFVDEQWCGLGHPTGLSGSDIPPLSRIILLAQTFEAFVMEEGIAQARAMVRERRGRWFEPALADHVLRWRRTDPVWETVADGERLESAVQALEPGTAMIATPDRLDAIAYGFAAVIDAKSPFTARHSVNMARYAAAIAHADGASPELVRFVLRAGLLHDLGKLGISNRILDKPGKLDDVERATMKAHPRWTYEILQRVPAFADVARPAALHHERLDGAGYPWGLRSHELEPVARWLAVADVYEALTADRPYRAGMPVEKVLRILGEDRNTAFDPHAIDIAAALGTSGVFAEIAQVIGDAETAVPGLPASIWSDREAHRRAGDAAPIIAARIAGADVLAQAGRASSGADRSGPHAEGERAVNAA